MMRKQALSLCFIFVFIFPILAAFVIDTHPALIHFKQTNHGYLLDPPKALSQLDLNLSQQGKRSFKTLQPRWLLLYFPNDCLNDKKDILRMHMLKQLRIALGKERDRVMNLALLPARCENKTLFSDEITLAFVSPQTQTFLEDKLHPEANLFIVDPYSNLIMAYTKNHTATDIYKDLKQLLKVSQIG